MSGLETALHFAGESKDIDSLKSLARVEAKRADDMTFLLCAVLHVAGQQTIPRTLLEDRPRFKLTLAQDPESKEYQVWSGFGVDEDREVTR